MNPGIKDKIFNDNENDCVIPSETRNLLQSRLPFNPVKHCHIERSRDTYPVAKPLNKVQATINPNQSKTPKK